VIWFCTRSDPDAVPACHGAWWGVRWGAPKCEKRERDVLVPTSTKRAYVVQEVRFVSVGWLVRFVCLIRVPVCPVCVPRGSPAGGLFMEEAKSPLRRSSRRRGTRVLLPGSRVCRARLHFADRLRAGAGRRALWERVEAGSGSLGVASSESAAGSGRLRACGC
jgi:hypothetical protein